MVRSTHFVQEYSVIMPVFDGFHRVLFAALVVFGPLPASAQYEVFQWASFEDGLFPENAVAIGANPAQTVQVVDLSTVQGMPAGFRSAEAVRETGRYGLKIVSTGKGPAYTTGLAVGAILDRDKLGKKGRAIYQADFYLPPGEGQLPSLAVLAMEPPRADGEPSGGIVKTVEKPYYRFGLTKGTSLYFSRFIPRDTKPPFYTKDTPLLQELPLPGWHRFAIVFDGPNHIRCYIDGRETRFSPLEQPSFRKLMVGVMLADNERAYDAYVDNLSIQLSQEAPQLPDSPFVVGWKIPPGPAAMRTQAMVDAGMPSARDPRWIDPLAAWETAQRSKRPMLLYFFAPGLPSTMSMENIFAQSPQAKSYLDQCVCARVDANQLRGGLISKQYQVFKYPAIIVMSPDAKASVRASLSTDGTWEGLAAQLRSQ